MLPSFLRFLPRCQLAVCLGFAALAPWPVSAAGTPADSAGAREQRTAWFREAKFGLFIHWGLYAIPAGEWQGRAVPGIGEWIMNRAKIPIADYSALTAQFNPVKFDAEEWVLLAKAAGMKYIAITSKHHDGFALFQSKVSRYNVVDATPFKRDIIAELAAACRKHGLRFGLYYSQSQDWYHAGGEAAGGKWDPRQQGDFDTYLRTIAEPQVRELLTGYGPLSLIWFDTPLNMNDQRVAPFVSAIRSLQPDCLINSRLLLRGADIKNLTAAQIAKAAEAGCDYISRGDNEIPPQAVPGLWETPATLNDTWGFKRDDHNWKSPADLVFKLVDIVSKGGNYLLNVGPTAEGVIPAPSQEALRAVGRWLKLNGEAIYGAGPTPFGDEFGRPGPATPPPPKAKGKKAGSNFLIAREWRCTTQPGRLYFHLFQWPTGGRFEVKGVSARAVRAHLLADSSRRPLELTQAGTTLSVVLPASAPGEYATVLCVETETASGAAGTRRD
ncbi:MAG: alpha-L-fucosidase [Verrucomicrobia bacterium]|nr:alpha-L-fucosidase [Verrucomicrobiota bacterium]